jgi:alpha-galactosidase
MSSAWLTGAPDAIRAETADGWTALSRRGLRWTASGLRVECGEGASGLPLTLRAEGVAVQRIRCRWRRRITGSVRVLGDHWERAYGDLEWRGLVPERVLPWHFLLHDGVRTHGVGVRTDTAALASWQVDAEGVTLLLDVRCGGRGVLLGDRELAMATVASRRGTAGETPFAAAGKFLSRLHGRPLPLPAPVYGANDWYYAYGKNDAARLVDDSQRTAELADGLANRPFSVIDAGWQYSGGCNGAPWGLPCQRFPDMAEVAARIRAAGCRPGIWYRPLFTSEDLAGTGLGFDRPGFPPVPYGVGQVLDPSVPAVRERLAEDMRRFTDWGFDLVKHDFSTCDLLGRWGRDMGAEITVPGWSFHDRSRTTAEIIAAFYDDLLAAAGDALVLGCNTINHLAAGRVHIQRTGDDTSGQEWERTRRMGVNALAFRGMQHGRFFAADADCVGLTEAIPWELNRQWLDLVARSGTPLFVSARRECLGRRQRAALRDAFRQASAPQPLGEPLDWLDTTCPTRWRFGESVAEYRWSED